LLVLICTGRDHAKFPSGVQICMIHTATLKERRGAPKFFKGFASIDFCGDGGGCRCARVMWW